jgi:cation-transporting ATPase 13A3/4/5
LSREEVESNLSFLGLLVMENKMKSETSAVIKTLHDCEVGTIMATGDSVLTAVSIARQCGIINR